MSARKGTIIFLLPRQTEGGRHAVITISRQMGSRGEEIGRSVADRLAIPYVDQEIVSEAAALARVSRNEVADVDESGPTWLTDFATNLWTTYALEPSLGSTMVETVPWIHYETYHRLTEAVIRDVADRGSAVIVGRGSQMILRDRQRAFHVHVVAPFDSRVWEIMKRKGVGQKEAECIVRESDRKRARYVQRYYRANWEDPLLYHLVLNTARVDEETAASAIIEGARSLPDACYPGASLRLVD